MASLLDLADAGADAGGKAHGLARLIAAGVPTPPGFVIAPAAFAALVGALPDPASPDHGHALGALAEAARHAEPPAALAAEVTARAAALGPRIAVRSSLAIEDRAGGAARRRARDRSAPASRRRSPRRRPSAGRRRPRRRR